ncbi:MAG: UDP-N-acetylmuramate--L-alanine ligase [Chloroflexi bacterium]|nr:MAG: UDP-N-acetylmuramate--L-alanine ligase [Chloroflexota bacterium]
MNDKEFTLESNMHIHLIGIGGSGISAIARVLLGHGYTVSGSDAQGNEITNALQTEGVTIFEGHAAAQIKGADLVVISSAIPVDNPEVVAAKDADIPVLKRSDFLGHLMTNTIGIAVAGSHGKTTTTGMVAQILIGGELDPTVIVGGVLPSLGTNGRFGQGDYFIIEADEYDNMFLGLRPEVAVITSLEHDHPDIFDTYESYRAAFSKFVKLLPDGGRLIACYEDDGVRDMLKNLNRPELEITTYGIAKDEGNQNDAPDYQALDLRPNNLGGLDFLVETEGQVIGLARLRVPGEHNVLNALAAIIVGQDVGIDFIAIQKSLAEFGGIGRRFQVIGEAGGVTVIDDYAHHPTEIKATLSAARQRYPGRRIWAVWQPHTYSRTKLLQDQFVQSFNQADRVVALDIYRSRETDTLGMNTAVIIDAMKHPNAIHVPKRKDAAAYILDRIHPDDVILTLGAGNGNMVGQWVLEGLQERLDASGSGNVSSSPN